MNSEEGKDKLAKSIADAVISYKKENFRPGTQDYHEEQPERPIVAVKPAEPKKDVAVVYAESKTGVLFKVQIAASGTDLPTIPQNFKGLNNISKSSEGKLFKYYYGETEEYDVAKQLLEEAKSKGYTSGFIVPFRDGKKITVQEALQKR